MTPAVPIALPITDDTIALIADRVAGLLAERLPSAASPWLTVADAATYLGCPTSRVYALKAARQIPHHKEGSRLLFHRDELDAWVRKGGGLRP